MKGSKNMAALKNIIYKELKMVIHPAVYLFSLVSALLLVPKYPHAIAMLYFVFPVQIALQLARSNKDLEFTATLPLSRSAVVISKHFTVAFLQLVQIAAALPFAIISSLVINKGGNIVGLDANFAFFGVTLLSYSAFNLAFLPAFYKTGYKIGLPYLFGALAYVGVLLLCELLIGFVPALNTALDSLNPATFIYQIPLLAAGILAYAGTLFLSFRQSVKNFEKVSL